MGGKVFFFFCCPDVFFFLDSNTLPYPSVKCCEYMNTSVWVSGREGNGENWFQINNLGVQGKENLICKLCP